MEKAALVFGVIMAVYGMMDLIERLAFWFLYPKGCSRYWVVPLCGRNEDVEYTVRCMAAERDACAYPSEKILLVDYGMDEESSRLAERICAELGVCFCTKEKMGEMIATRLQGKETMI